MVSPVDSSSNRINASSPKKVEVNKKDRPNKSENGTLSIINPPINNVPRIEHLNMTPEEKRVYKVIIRTCGRNELSPEDRVLLKPDISRCITDISIDDDKISSYFDGRTMHFGKSHIRNMNDLQLQNEAANAIGNYAMLTYKTYKDSPAVLKGLLSELYRFMFRGFADDKIAFLSCLITTSLPAEEKVAFESLLESGSAKTDITKMVGELFSREVRLYDGIKDKPTDQQIIEHRNIKRAYELLYLAGLAFGLKTKEMDGIYNKHLISVRPELRSEALLLVKEKDEKGIYEVYSRLSGSADPLDKKKIMKNEFLLSIISYYFFQNKTTEEVNLALLSRNSGNVDPKLLEIYSHFRWETLDPRVSILLMKKVPPKLESYLTETLAKASKSEQQKMRLNALTLLDELSREGVLLADEKADWQMRIMWPDLTKEELSIFSDLETTDEVKYKKAKELIKNEDLKKHSAGFSEALSYYLLRDDNDIGTQKLIADLTMLSDEVDKYYQELSKAMEALKSGKKELFMKLWKALDARSGDLEISRKALDERNNAHYQKLNVKLFGGNGDHSLNYDKTRARTSSFFDLTGRTAKSIFSSVKDGWKLDVRSIMRNTVIDDFKMEDYTRTNILTISWNLHARLKEIAGIITAKRMEHINKYAKAEGVDSYLVAAMVICEQRDQSNMENITDIIGGVLGYNSSIGLGQITVQTARELFPELFKGASDVKVALKLRNEEFNIQAVAKLLKKHKEEGKNTLGREPSIQEMGSRYTSSSFTATMGWGRFVEKAYYEAKIMGMPEPDYSALFSFFR